MSGPKCTILFLGKKNDEHVREALDFCELNVNHIDIYQSKWGEPLPKEIRNWKGDYIVSYLSRWIVPEYILSKARVASINFHPGPPEYPGIGCVNFALYEGAKSYGVTCHHMASRVDTGKIIAVERFPIFKSDTVASLLVRTYNYQVVLFYKVMEYILKGKELPISEEKWTRKPLTRTELNKLGKITSDMNKEEIDKRVRATNFDIWKPTIELYNYIFELK